LEALKITEKIIGENAFEHKKKKPGLNLTWVLTAINKKGTYNIIPPMEIIVIIIPTVSAVQCNILDTTFFSCSHLNVIHRPRKTADLMLQILESAFPPTFSGTKHLNIQISANAPRPP